MKRYLFFLLLIIIYSCERNGFSEKQNEYEEVINVYFNKSADISLAYPGNKANYNVNLEDKLIKRIEKADSTIDLAVYEINLPKLITKIIQKAADGIDVRMVVDAKEYTEEGSGEVDEHDERYNIMRLYLEKMRRGMDKILNTDDDIYIIADSPIFAVTDSDERIEFDLPNSPDDFPFVQVKIGNDIKEGYLVADAAKRKSAGCPDSCYYSPGDQMHNKFAVIDNEWVFTGSWNFTVTGLYGTEEDMRAGKLNGNQQHVVEIKSEDLAEIYTKEFNEMYGSRDLLPNADSSKFHKRKLDNTGHTVNVDGVRVDVYFSPSDSALSKIINLVKTEADSSIIFTIFAFSDQKLVDEMKYKWEASYEDSVGERTGSRESELNPNIRWKNEAPVYKDNETRKLHSKSMVIDNDIVVVGSINWSTNGDQINDENTLIIYDKNIVNQFKQEMTARYNKAKSN
ncbi:MAG: phospholipase D-like domain-containing protein [Ignavibacteria bacterium]|jgi:phosphatidylserine/phosphatidylglycerophosphate/cardiolipin synthase-like enzyme